MEQRLDGGLIAPRDRRFQFIAWSTKACPTKQVGHKLQISERHISSLSRRVRPFVVKCSPKVSHSLGACMLGEVFLLSHEIRLWSSTRWRFTCPERRTMPRLRLAPVLMYSAAPQAKTSRTGGSLCDSCSLRDQEPAGVFVPAC